MANCVHCPEYFPDTETLIAPHHTRDQKRRWEGRIPVKPWHQPVTVAIPHLNTLDSLEVCVGLLRCQTIQPYILVIDTGSPADILEKLEDLRWTDCEVHYLRAHAWLHNSSPAAAAMDVAFALCRSKILVALHSDVYLKRRDSLEWLADMVYDQCPVAGWEQSPREGTTAWQGSVSHTFTAFWMPKMRKIGATWGFERYYEYTGIPDSWIVGFPDTEQPINLCLELAGIQPLILGREPNWSLHRTEWFDHARALTGVRAYQDVGAEQRKTVEKYAAEALADARDRLAKWSE
jgi:hypothetical protein